MLFFDIEAEVSLHFECPKCDSDCWGTRDMNTERAMGHCSTCNFKWPRSEDHKVMFVKLTPVDDADQKTFFDRARAAVV